MSLFTKKWWDVWPGRLEFELQALDQVGIKRRLDPDALAKGIVRIELELDHDGKTYHLVAIFPESYPFFRPEVLARDLSLTKHQNPFSGGLCLLDRGTYHWDTDFTLAMLIRDQFPQVYAAAMGKKTSNVEEAEQGEPITAFYEFTNDWMILNSLGPVPPELAHGTFEVKFSRTRPNHPLGWLSRINAPGFTGLENVPPPQFSLLLRGEWLRLSQAPPEEKASAIEGFLRQQQLLPDKIEFHRLGDVRVNIIGLLFDEELQIDVRGNAWLFLVRVKDQTGKIHRHLVRAGRASLAEEQPRISTLEFIRTKKIVAVGLGSLGAPVAIELARAGIGELRVIDHDFIEPGTTVRWPLGLDYAGLNKATAVRRFIELNYPRTKVKPLVARIGAVTEVSGEMAALHQLIDGADMIVDCTAERGVHYLLSEIAREQKQHYIVAYATPGGVGGAVARFSPDSARGCWFCFQRALNDQLIQSPPIIEHDLIQPPGCAERTFVATNFDLHEVALETMRTICSALSPGRQSDYPTANWNVSILSMQSDDGRQVPSWQTCSLMPYSDCHCQK